MKEFKDLKIAVAGTGYVGLSIATLLSQHHQVVAVDIVPEKVELINNKKSPNGYEKNVTPLVVVVSGKLKIQNLQKGLAKNIEKLLASNIWGTKRYLNMKHYMQR